MYARGKTAIVLRISITTIVLNLVFNWLLVGPFGYPGLALTSSLVSVYYLGVSTFVVYKDFDASERVRLAKLFARVVLPTLVMAIPLYLIKQFTPISELYSLIQLGILVPLGVVLYVAGVYLFYREGFRQLLGILRKKKAA